MASIRLADVQPWTFPAPPGVADRPSFRPDYEAAVRATLEAEDEAERLRAELALAISLLSRNYALGPAHDRAAFELTPGDPRLAAVQGAFRELALARARRLAPEAGVAQVLARRRVPVPAGWLGSLLGRVPALRALVRWCGGRGPRAARADRPARHGGRFDPG